MSSCLQVQPGTPSAGALTPGDTIVGIGSTNAKSLTHMQAHQLIKSAGNVLQLTLLRCAACIHPLSLVIVTAVSSYCNCWHGYCLHLDESSSSTVMRPLAPQLHNYETPSSIVTNLLSTPLRSLAPQLSMLQTCGITGSTIINICWFLLQRAVHGLLCHQAKRPSEVFPLEAELD